jgi:hypothetical protein
VVPMTPVHGDFRNSPVGGDAVSSRLTLLTLSAYSQSPLRDHVRGLTTEVSDVWERKLVEPSVSADTL